MYVICLVGDFILSHHAHPGATIIQPVSQSIQAHLCSIVSRRWIGQPVCKFVKHP